MKSHFPLVTQRARTELWTERRGSTSVQEFPVPEILLSVQPPCSMHPTVTWAQLAAPSSAAAAAQSNSLHTPLLHQISRRHSDQQNTGAEQQSDKEHGLICSPCCSLSAM